MEFSINNNFMLNSVSDFTKLNGNSKSDDEQKTNLIQNSSSSVFADKEIKSESNITLKDLEALNEDSEDIEVSKNEETKTKADENKKDDSKPIAIDETNCDKVMSADAAKIYRGAVKSGKVADCNCQYKDGTMLFTDKDGNIKMVITSGNDYVDFEIIHFFEGRRAQGEHLTKDPEKEPILADKDINPNKDKWVNPEVIFEYYSWDWYFDKMISGLEDDGFDFNVA